MFSELISAPILLIVVSGVTFHVARAAIINSHQQQQITDGRIFNYDAEAKSPLETPRKHYRPITDCMFVTSESGPFSYISPSDTEVVCGIYFLTDPDRTVEIHFHNYDIPCNQDGLIGVIDGWELNGEIFPNENDHLLPMKDRVNEFCGKNRRGRIFTSSQNAAIVQYRIPVRGKGFVISARFPENPRPCNVLSISVTDPFTLRNYGRRINCSLVAIFPGSVQIIALDVGRSNSRSISRMIETGILHKCDAKDRVQIGGSQGLNTTKVDIIDSICGIDSKPDAKQPVAYEVTSVRLVSSGHYDNSVTVVINPFIDDNLESVSGH